MEKYSRRVVWSHEDQCYIATVPEFPSLSAFGETVQAALDGLDAALEAAIEMYRQEGRKLPEPRRVVAHSGQFRLRLPKSLHAALVERAEQEGVSLNTLALHYLAQGLGQATAQARDREVNPPLRRRPLSAGRSSRRG